MRGKIIISFVALITLYFGSCTNDTTLNIQLPDGSVIQQGKISEIEKIYKCEYKQYKGFVLEYKDTLFSNPILLLKNNNNVVGADVLSDKEIDKLKTYNIEAIKFTYTLPTGKKERDTNFEKYLKSLYKNFDEETPIEKGFELKKGGKVLLKVELYTIAIPNYSIIIYPM